MTIDKQVLRDIAESVEREEWETLDNGDDGYQVIVKGSLERGGTYRSYQPVSNEISERKIATFIAAFGPATVLALLDELEALQSFRTAYMEWSDKTDWVQTDKRFDVIKPWGKHRADVLKLYIDHLESKLEAKEEQRANWFQMAQKLGEDLEAAEKRIAELREWNAGLAQESFERQQRIAELEARAFNPAILDVIAERQRQQSVEGWTPEHDDLHDSGELAGAAACYAHYTNARGWVFPTNPGDYQSADEPDNWPWDRSWWKPTNPRRDLVKAGALILAEIERIDRAAGINVEAE